MNLNNTITQSTRKLSSLFGGLLWLNIKKAQGRISENLSIRNDTSLPLSYTLSLDSLQ